MSVLALAELGLASQAGSVLVAAGFGVAVAGALFTAYALSISGPWF